MSRASAETEADAIEELYARGVTDGLPVVPPTPSRAGRGAAAPGRRAAGLGARAGGEGRVPGGGGRPPPGGPARPACRGRGGLRRRLRSSRGVGDDQFA